MKKNPPSKKKGKGKSKRADDDEMDIVNLLMSQNKEERKMKRRQRKADNKMWMKALTSMTKCVMAAITTNPTALDEESNINSSSSSSSSDSESFGSYSSNDTPPTKRNKIRAGKTKKNAQV